VTVRDKRLVAYHEAGHAVVDHYLPEADKVHEISIIPRGKGAGGYTMSLPSEETHYMPGKKLKAMMCGLMGGHCAEKLVFGDVTTGSTSDLKRATELARSMVTEYGMSEKLGPMFLGGEQEVFLGRNFSQSRSNISEDVSRMIDEEIRALLDESYEQAARILNENRDKLDRLAQLLQEREKINEAEFIAVMNGEAIPAEATEAEKTSESAAAEETESNA
jgi:cell division protease FtsH